MGLAAFNRMRRLQAEAKAAEETKKQQEETKETAVEEATQEDHPKQKRATRK